MAKQCPDCSQIFPDFVDFCVQNGAPLVAFIPPLENVDSLATTVEGEPVTASYDSIPEARIIVLNDQGEGETVAQFSPDIVLGRGDSVDFDLSQFVDDESIREQHLLIGFEQDEWYVQRLAQGGAEITVNGTQLQAEKRQLAGGEKILIGQLSIVFDTFDQVGMEFEETQVDEEALGLLPTLDAYGDDD